MSLVRSLNMVVVTALNRIPSSIVLLASFLIGAAWGIVARFWMRFITSDPEFTWGGTLAIVLVFGVMFLGQAGVYLGRRAGVRTSGFVALRALAIVALIPLAAAAGAPAFPILVLAPLALVRTRWNRWLRVLLGLLAFATGVFVASSLFSYLTLPHAVAGAAWFVLIYGVLGWAVCFSFASRNDPNFGGSITSR